MPTIHKPVDDGAMNRFVDWLNNMLREAYEDHPSMNPVMVLEPGPKNIRVVKKDNPNNDHGSAYCFVEKATGKIMKPAGYKSPEPKRYERGNVNNPETWKGWCGPHGVQTFR